MSSPSVSAAGQPPFRDPALPLRKRVDDLLERLTVDERHAMLHQYAPAIPRLGVAAFRTGSEALHGVSWLGEATAPHRHAWPRRRPTKNLSAALSEKLSANV